MIKRVSVDISPTIGRPVTARNGVFTPCADWKTHAIPDDHHGACARARGSTYRYGVITARLTLGEIMPGQTMFSNADTSFIQHLVQFDYVGKRTSTGWSPNLLYQSGGDICTAGAPVISHYEFELGLLSALPMRN